MPNYAQITLIGHLGRDVEQRAVASGDMVARFSVAVTSKRSDQETTTWYRISAWGKTGDACAQYLRKGAPVQVVGTPSLSTYTDRDGQTRSSIEVRAESVTFLGSREASAEPVAHTASGDLPF